MYSTDDTARADYEAFLRDEMADRKKEIGRSILANMEGVLMDALLKLLAAAHSWDLPEVDAFLVPLNLSKADLCCLKDDLKKYKESLLEDENDSAYAHAC